MEGGDTFVYHFDGLQYQGKANVPPPAGFLNLLFDPGTVNTSGPAGMLRMELFEGLAEGTPVAERTIMPGIDTAFLQSETAWSDHEGTIRLTAISGTFTINEVHIGRRDDALNGMDFYQITVPEPSTFALGLLGAAACCSAAANKYDYVCHGAAQKWRLFA